MRRAFRGGLALVVAMLAAACATLPPPGERTVSHAIEPDLRTRLGTAVGPLAAAHPGRSGIHALPIAPDAFAARVLLAMAADRTIDAQYYIWHADDTGVLLLDSLRQAASRGVRVRLLVDDQNTRGAEPLLATLAAQPHVEVRLYNPFANRSLRALGYLGDFARLNRRMHNKSFTADNLATIVGGRNIGNEYFGAATEVPFKDLDVIAIGAAVPEVSAQFDLYWNSASAYPFASVASVAPDLAAFDEHVAAVRASGEAQAYLAAVRDTPLIRNLLASDLELEWAEAHVVRDDPAKTLDHEPRAELLLLPQLAKGDGRPRRSFDLISPYFVPGERGTAFLAGLARDGVRVRVLTNSLAATDVSVVHSGYAKRRCELARAGVRLYELRARPAGPDAARKDDDGHGSGSSAASLHAKTFAADEARIFVGSFNFDPRSALLNTEMGLVIESPVLAGRLARVFDEGIPAMAYEVRSRNGEACVTWVERTAGGEVVHETEPDASWLRRAWLSVLMVLPLDWML